MQLCFIIPRQSEGFLVLVVVIRIAKIDTYNQVKKSGCLPESQWQVYHTFFNHGPMTKKECWESIKKEFNLPQLSPGAVGFCINELLTAGAVAEQESRKCSVTRITALTWDVTDVVPGMSQRVLSPIRLLRLMHGLDNLLRNKGKISVAYVASTQQFSAVVGPKPEYAYSGKNLTEVFRNVVEGEQDEQDDNVEGA